MKTKPVELPYELAMQELIAGQRGFEWTPEIDRLICEARGMSPPIPYPKISTVVKKYFGVSISTTTLRDHYERALR